MDSKERIEARILRLETNNGNDRIINVLKERLKKIEENGGN